MAKINDLIMQNDDKKLVLPDFQRDLEWSNEKQRSLLASILVNLPIGSLLLLQGKGDSFAAREIGVPDMRITPYADCLYLLDGQQRLTSLKSAFTDFFDVDDWKTRWDKLYSALRVRWFLKIKPANGSSDIFGFNKLELKNINEFEPGDLIDNIIDLKVYKTKTNQIHNPGYRPKDENGNFLTKNKKELLIANHYAENGIVPLYSLFGGDKNSLHSKTIYKIAQNRTSEIKAEVSDIEDLLLRKESLISLFSELDENIQEYVEDEECFADDIERLWSLLSSNWAISLINLLESILNYDIALIELPLSEIARAVSIFTSINEGGQKLDNYDLIVAKAAKDPNKESLTKRIKEQVSADKKLISSLVGPNFALEQKWQPTTFNLVEGLKICKDFKDHYLNMLSIYSHTNYGNLDEIKLEHTKAKSHLALTHLDINDNTEKVIAALIKTYAFLQYRCGISWLEKMPYKLMALPIAYLMFKPEVWSDAAKINKIEYWYWVSLFGGYYREGQNDRCINDLANLYNWVVNDSENPFTSRFASIFTGTKYSDLETLTLQSDETPPNAIINALQQYILSSMPRDFLPSNYTNLKLKAWEVSRAEKVSLTKNIDGNDFSENIDLKVEVHHIIPLSTAASLGQSTKSIRNDKKHILNSPLNLTVISSKANSLLSDMSPDRYIKLIAEHAPDRHFLPIAEEFNAKEGESEDERYIRLLRSRFSNIKQAIVNELDGLIE